MREKILNFFKEVYHTDYDDFTINYRVVEYSSLVEAYTMEKALGLFQNDLEDMSGWLPDSKVFEAVCSIWKKHLVV